MITAVGPIGPIDRIDPDTLSHPTATIVITY